MAFSKKVFFVDDDPDDVEIFKEIVSDICKNCHLSVFSDGCFLLQNFERKKAFLPDLIFLDLNMPKVGGLEVLGGLSSLGILSKVPVVIFSTSTLQSQVCMAYNKGAYLYLEKASSYSKLKKDIENILNINWQTVDYPVSFENFLVSS